MGSHSPRSTAPTLKDQRQSPHATPPGQVQRRRKARAFVRAVREGVPVNLTVAVQRRVPPDSAKDLRAESHLSFRARTNLPVCDDPL